MKLYYWNPKLFNQNQKTNYITITLATKIDAMHQNKGLIKQNNSLSVFLKINHIKILLEKYKLKEEKKNLITFFIMKNEIGPSFNSVGDKEKNINVFVVYDYEYFKKVFSIQRHNIQDIENEVNINRNSQKMNNEFIQAIMVKKVLVFF